MNSGSSGVWSHVVQGMIPILILVTVLLSASVTTVIFVFVFRVNQGVIVHSTFVCPAERTDVSVAHSSHLDIDTRVLPFTGNGCGSTSHVKPSPTKDIARSAQCRTDKAPSKYSGWYRQPRATSQGWRERTLVG
jgi:hypothetical protein